MKLKSASIKNFRMLKNLDIDFEDVLSLIIGKNNVGKTSFLSILQKFLAESKPEFTFEDFNVEIQNEILSYEHTNKTLEEYEEPALSLKLCISYKDTDNLGKASLLLLDLDSEMHNLVVMFEYVLVYEKYLKLIKDYAEFKASGVNRTFDYYIKRHINKYFSTRIRALEYGNEGNFKLINNDIVNSIISMQIIGAKRDVDNEQGRSKSLSLLASKYYNSSITSEVEFPELQKKLSDTDESLTKIYQDLFKPIVDEIAEMSYNPQEAKLSIISTLSEKKIFQDNTTVKYNHENSLLPEDYNGLGYLNLFAIIFNIRIKLDLLSKKNNNEETPTPLNLLFIEEPEAHTHPQMQYVFIKNVKRILEQHCKAAGDSFSLQTIISTHSSHIVSQCDFEDIKYFYRESSVSVKSRSLKTLHKKMVTSQNEPSKKEQERLYRFVKQYVTLNRAELFFADKAVLIEGDTERMLFSAMMKKTDDAEIRNYNLARGKAESENDREELLRLETNKKEPLLSQNISVIEVGAYSHIFATFLGFLKIKTLIVTDLDCAKQSDNGRFVKCCYSEGTTTTNASIKFFTEKTGLAEIVKLVDNPIIFNYDDKKSKWIYNPNGSLRLIFQKDQHGYQARSFEDAFICRNLQFIVDNKDKFIGLKNRSKLTSTNNDFYSLAEECIDSKTSFALDILLHGGEENENWETPMYIEEGLKWLAQ
ncbi:MULTISPECIES: ATP-dependent endonuclease [unclassified Breznakia]|uniref:ATP-dependent nuclease n=1 Tax=unclassified Breznakia TaxID=2623764 RepID=UPI002475D8FB|nr:MULTISPECIES: ATP-dependent endonuclease [unclassified Breznakia]MDH6366418.1 putative ATP-dependent endonuclease of OLD family [Breznakia sp. PH1-1]MDH6403511.1 putative ATP-dependent endonuclease of OLD family [Breznakia sp. PF1-11]MDH6411220.1 putative ATP-dependent endonuclease of OLD family [Breznakia sp. PFB1-11]MDH6413517.1 putative ATP-dependent endonuclease of OLD family [Breznakia sp. PFB1-14]MDH6415765.1 putative ATP-dependent endonuclease of OLD family [Breznakia sp. PFB1-4]